MWKKSSIHSRRRRKVQVAKVSCHGLEPRPWSTNIYARTELTGVRVERDSLLKQLHNSTKIRTDAVLEPLYSKRGVRILGLYAFDDSPKPEHLPALRCLNNVLVRSTPARQFLDSEIGASKFVSLLKVEIYICDCESALSELTMDLSATTQKMSWLWRISSSSHAMEPALT